MPNPVEERAQRAAARLGTWLHGKWRLDRVLGAGGMATVYAATHRNGLHVAVKMLHAELSIVTEARQRFVNEGYAANRIGHPGVVTVLDDDVDDDGSAYLVMELLDGESLEDLRERRGGALPPREVLELAERALDVLAVAHDKGVIHRDLKPENLFLTREGRLKIVDFGLARLLELTGDARLTASGAGTMGTPAFLPPEQARGRWQDIDGRTDLWALGATMYTLLSGRYVHEAGTVNEAIALAITRPAPPVSRVAPGLPKAVAAVVDRAVAMNPIDRFQDARAMADAVRRALAETPVDAPLAAAHAPTMVAASSGAGLLSEAPEPPTVRLGSRPPGRLRGPLLIGLGAIAAVATAVLVFARSPSPPLPAAVTPAAASTAATSAVIDPPPVVVVAPSAAVPTASIVATASTSSAPAARKVGGGSGPPETRPPASSARPASTASAQPKASDDDALDRRH